MSNNQRLYNIFWIGAAVILTVASLYIEYYPYIHSSSLFSHPKIVYNKIKTGEIR